MIFVSPYRVGTDAQAHTHSPRLMQAKRSASGGSCTRAAEIFFVGRKEVVRYAHEDVDLQGVEGIHVVCASEGEVLTAYRNRGRRPPRARWG